MSDESAARKVIPFGQRAKGDGAPGQGAAGDVGDRLIALEAGLASLERNIANERRLLSSLANSDAALGEAMADPRGQSAMPPLSDEERGSVERAIDERRRLTNEVAQLRFERDALVEQIRGLRTGAVAQQAPTRSGSAATPEDLAETVDEIRAKVQELVEQMQRTPLAEAAPRADPVADASTGGPSTVPDAPQEDVEELPADPWRFARREAAPPVAASETPHDEITRASDVAVPEPLKAARSGAFLEEEDVSVGDVDIDLVPEDAAPGAAPLEPPPPVEFETAVVDTVDTPVSEDTAALWDAIAVPPEDAPLAGVDSIASDVAPPTIEVAPAPMARAWFLTDEFIEETRQRPRPLVAAPVAVPSAPPAMVTQAPLVEHRPAPETLSAPAHSIQVVISPIHSVAHVLEIEGRLRTGATVRASRLQDYRGGVATFVLELAEAIGAEEFGLVLQMMDLRLRLLGGTGTSVELRLDEAPTTT